MNVTAPLEVTFTPARETDVHSLSALNNSFAPQGLTLPRSEAFVESHLHDYRVARGADGRVIGCVCLDDYAPSLVELVALAVQPAFHGRGLGSRLIAEAVKLARKRDYPEIFAVSFSDNLFLHCGFARTPVERYPEKKVRYDRVSEDEWTIGEKHCFAMRLDTLSA